MTKSKAQIERERVEEVVTDWVNKFYLASVNMERLSYAIEKLNLILPRRLDYSGIKRKDNPKKAK